MCKALSWNQGELGQSVNTNGGQKAIIVCIFWASVKTKEVKREWFLPRLVEDIGRKYFCSVFASIHRVSFINWFEENVSRSVICKCVVSYFEQLISFPSESNSLDSEQSFTSEEEKPLPSSKSGESMAHVVKPSTSYQRSKTSINFRDHDSVLKLFGPSEIVHSYYTCNKNCCFSLTGREQKKSSTLKRDHFKHQWISDDNLAFDSCIGMWWVTYKEE